jgi:SAM-dependent methyltransferase
VHDRVLELVTEPSLLLEALLQQYSPRQAVSLHFSSIATRENERKDSNSVVEQVECDGRRIPFAQNQFDAIYWVACSEPNDNNVVVLLREIYRVLAFGGRAVLRFPSIHALANGGHSDDNMGWDHNRNAEAHWHYFYCFDELVVLLSDVIGVSDLDIHHVTGSFWTYFSKGASRKFARPEVDELGFLKREEASRRTEDLRLASARLELVEKSAGWRFLQRVRQPLARLLPTGSRRGRLYRLARQALRSWVE